MYPEVEDGELEFRAGPLNWLNEKYSAAIRSIALTNGEEAYSWNHWDESRTVDNLGRQNPEAMQAAIDEGKITGEQFDKAVGMTPRSFYESLLEDITDTKEQLTLLEKTIDAKFGLATPSLIKIRNVVDDYSEVVSNVVKKKRLQDPSYKQERESGTNEISSSQSFPSDNEGQVSAVHWSGEPRSREEAFQRLSVIAGYLKRVEPQHPVSYLLERAVKWTKMPLDQWLNEVINNQDVLNNLRETLGIKERDDT
jgi:type VI secretion system protein ImpA